MDGCRGLNMGLELIVNTTFPFTLWHNIQRITPKNGNYSFDASVPTIYSIVVDIKSPEGRRRPKLTDEVIPYKRSNN